MEHDDIAHRRQPERRLNAVSAGRLEAMRVQLGLEVVETKISVDTFVVDRVEKVPTGN